MTQQIFEKDTTSTDAFVGGKLLITQPKEGFRAGLDSVLLAASLRVMMGQKVLELGAGTGLMSLHIASQAMAHIYALEIDESAVKMMKKNIENNVLKGCVSVIHTDICDIITSYSREKRRESQGYVRTLHKTPDQLIPNPKTIDTTWLSSFDHVLFNPPFFISQRARISPKAGKGVARAMEQSGIDVWVSAAEYALKPKGSVTFFSTPETLTDYLERLKTSFGDIKIKCIHTTLNDPARLCIIKAIKGSKGPLEIRPPLVTHTQNAGQKTLTNTVKGITQHGSLLEF